MRVIALRTVYNRSESKEYQKGEIFEASDREARVMMKLRKVEAAAGKSEPKPAASNPTAPLQTAAMKADQPTPANPADAARRYKRRDLQAQD